MSRPRNTRVPMIEPAPDCALLMIDFQRDFLRPDGRMPVNQTQVAPVLAAAVRAMMRFRTAGCPVVAIGNEFRRGEWLMNLLRRGAAVAGSPGAAWDDRLPLKDATYFAKWAGDAFVNPALEPWLRQAGVRRLVLTGVFARACITSTARGALARGFEVHALAEAIGCASDVTRARALTRLAQGGVRVACEEGCDDFAKSWRHPGRSACASGGFRGLNSSRARGRSGADCLKAAIPLGQRAAPTRSAPGPAGR